MIFQHFLIDSTSVYTCFIFIFISDMPKTYNQWTQVKRADYKIYLWVEYHRNVRYLTVEETVARSSFKDESQLPLLDKM